MNLMCQILDDYDSLDDLDKKELLDRLNTAKGSLEMNKGMQAFFNSRTNYLKLFDPAEMKSGCFEDAWGKPLLFSWKDSATNAGLGSLVQMSERPFVVWSSGPNRSNEFGGGDDILPVGR